MVVPTVDIFYTWQTTYPDVEIATHAMVEEIQDSDASTRVV